MQIQIDMNTINKYIHAQEATVTKANPYIETDELSTKAKSLLVKLVERGFYFKISTTTLNTLKEELGGELVGELTSNNDVAVTTEDTPVNGAVVVNTDGTFTYTPTDSYVGEDTFDFTVTDEDAGETRTETATITIETV